MSTFYILVTILICAIGAMSFIVSRMRRTPEIDHVSQNVLDRIRTEYR